MVVACEKCYPCSGLKPIGGTCGCNCDPCNRCCNHIFYCNSITFRVQVFNDPECFAPSAALDASDKKNDYDIFFNKLKNYTFFNNKKLNIYNNPLFLKRYQKLKPNKKEKNIKLFNFEKKSVVFKFESPKKKWFHFKKQIYADYFYRNKFNYCLWDGKNWHFYNKKIKFKKNISYSPFFIILDDYFNIIKTNNENINKNNLKNIIEDFENNNSNLIYKRKLSVVNYQNKSTNVVFHKQNLAESCVLQKICYEFVVVFTPSDNNGCGLCCPFVDIGNMFVYSVGGVGVNFTPYSDEYVYLEGISGAYVRDGLGTHITPVLTPCGELNGLAVNPYSTDVCPCRFYSPCNQDPNANCAPPSIKENLSMLRNQYRKYFEKNKFKRKIR